MTSYRIVALNDVVQMTVEGDLDFEGSRKLLLEAAAGAETAGHNLLVDLRNAQGNFTFREVYRLVQLLSQHPDAFSGRIALLDLYDERFEKAQFFEASAAELGFQVRTFLEEDKAIAWLERESG